MHIYVLALNPLVVASAVVALDESCSIIVSIGPIARFYITPQFILSLFDCLFSFSQSVDLWSAFVEMAADIVGGIDTS